MIRRFSVFLYLFLVLFVFSGIAQVVSIGSSSEWEASGFNNGRRMVRDTNGYFHMVWHSQVNPNAAPAATGSHIYYACVTDTGIVTVPPQNMTLLLGDLIDSRYPSIAIEYDAVDGGGSWLNYNQLHVVWQGFNGRTQRYDVFHHTIPVNNPPFVPAPFSSGSTHNLSNSRRVDSLVPAIAINEFNPDPNIGQNIHVVWQEEDVNGPYGTDAAGSEIFYSRSTDCGNTWSFPANLTNTADNSQMPSIACALDTYYGTPPQYMGNDSAYLSDDVHVSYNEDTWAGGINVYYLRSSNNGIAWNAPVNLSGDPAVSEGYSNIAVDMQDRMHVVCMNDLSQNEPLQPGYIPGFDPFNVNSFPGPNPGMYHITANSIIYYGAAPYLLIQGSHHCDREFPTIALDREQNLDLNWQEHYIGPAGSILPPSYDVLRIQCLNATPVSRPLGFPVYTIWGPSASIDSNDYYNDYLFPNLAHKKVSMYFNINNQAHNVFTEIWTKLTGLGRPAAVAALAKTIQELSDALRDPFYF